MFGRKSKKKRKINIFERLSGHGFWYWFVVGLIFVAAFSVASMSISMLGSILYEIELTVIAFLRQPITLQLWFLILLFGISIISGYFSVPVLSIPATDEWYILLRVRRIGYEYVFQTVRGLTIRTMYENVRRKRLHWFIHNEVSSRWDEEKGSLIYESEKLEYSKYEKLVRENEILADQNARLQAMVSNMDSDFIEKHKYLHSKEGEEE